MPDIFVASKEEEKKDIIKASKPEVESATRIKRNTSESVSQLKNNPLATYVLQPDGVRFDTQRGDEQIVLFLRQHWATNLPWVILSVVFVAVPLIFFPTFTLGHLLPILPANFWFIIFLFWYLFIFGFALISFMGWYFNVYIISNERVIDVDFFYLLYNKVSSTRIDRLQDVSYKLGGIFRAIFDFGDVYVQTAGSEPNFDFLSVPHPETVVRKIVELMEFAGKGEI